MENFLFPDEIVLKILGYLGLGELIQCSKVSRRFNTICKDKSLGYRSSMLIVKDLEEEDQECINKIIIARPEMTKVVIDSVYWEEDNGKILSRAMAKRKFLGPKSYCLAKKRKVLKALGASVCVNNFRKGAPYSCFQRRPLEIGLFYYMPTLFYRRLSSWDLSGIEDVSQKRALAPTCPTYSWKKKILHPYLSIN